MRIAICDDENQYRTILLYLVNEYADKHKNYDISVTAFSHAKDLLNATSDIGGFDIYILDIAMPDIDGIDLGVRLRQMSHNGIIIYLTSSKKYAIDSYKVKAFNYLLKPIEPTSFISALEEAIGALSDTVEKSIIIKTKDSNMRISFNDIMYVELCNRIAVLHLINGSTVESTYLRIPFSQAMQELLTDNRFMLCERGFIVNLSHITVVGTDDILFNDSHKVYLSKRICNSIRSAWSDFWSK